MPGPLIPPVPPLPVTTPAPTVRPPMVVRGQGAAVRIAAGALPRPHIPPRSLVLPPSALSRFTASCPATGTSIEVRPAEQAVGCCGVDACTTCTAAADWFPSVLDRIQRNARSGAPGAWRFAGYLLAFHHEHGIDSVVSVCASLIPPVSATVSGTSSTTPTRGPKPQPSRSLRRRETVPRRRRRRARTGPDGRKRRRRCRLLCPHPHALALRSSSRSRPL